MRARAVAGEGHRALINGPHRERKPVAVHRDAGQGDAGSVDGNVSPGAAVFPGDDVVVSVERDRGMRLWNLCVDRRVERDVLRDQRVDAQRPRLGAPRERVRDDDVETVRRVANLEGQRSLGTFDARADAFSYRSARPPSASAKMVPAGVVAGIAHAASAQVNDDVARARWRLRHATNCSNPRGVALPALFDVMVPSRHEGAVCGGNGKRRRRAQIPHRSTALHRLELELERSTVAFRAHAHATVGGHRGALPGMARREVGADRMKREVGALHHCREGGRGGNRRRRCWLRWRCGARDDEHQRPESGVRHICLLASSAGPTHCGA